MDITRLNCIIEHLGDKILLGTANVYEHRAWVRGYYFRQYMLSRVFASERTTRAHAEYLLVSERYWCPECFYPVEPAEVSRVFVNGKCKACDDKRHTVDARRLEAEDNQPARQPPALQ